MRAFNASDPVATASGSVFVSSAPTLTTEIDPQFRVLQVALKVILINPDCWRRQAGMPVLLRLSLVVRDVIDVVSPELVQSGYFLISQRTLHSRRNSHHQRPRRNDCARRDQ